MTENNRNIKEMSAFIWKSLFMEIELQINWNLKFIFFGPLCIFQKTLNTQDYLKNWSKRPKELSLMKI